MMTSITGDAHPSTCATEGCNEPPHVVVITATTDGKPVTCRDTLCLECTCVRDNIPTEPWPCCGVWSNNHASDCYTLV